MSVTQKVACIDVELAVALEVGATRIERAEQLGGLEAALAYNRELWRVIGFLAHGGQLERRRDELQAQALAVAEGRCGDFLAVNRRFAGLFAAQSAAYGVMSVTLNDWRQFHRANPKSEFSQWLLERLAGQIRHAMVA